MATVQGSRAFAVFVGSALLGGLACASSPDEVRVEPAPEFVRPQGAWTPEDLHRDLIRCLDEAHGAVLAEFAASRAGPATARRAMRARTSECMARSGWSPRSTARRG